MRKGLLKCKVGKGMFKGEKIVAFDVVGGKVNSTIVNEKDVEGTFLKVKICKTRRNGNEILVRIPGEPFSSRKIWIPNDKVWVPA